MKKWILSLFLLANLLVLLGQLWPGEMPLLVERGTLVILLANAGYFALAMMRAKRRAKKQPVR